MASEARIVLYAKNDSMADGAVRAAFADMERIDSLLSDYRATSEVARLAQIRAGVTATVSAELAVVMSTALSLSRQTSGAFDVTAGPLTLLWRESRRHGTIPEAARVCTAMSSVGWRHVDLDTAKRSIRFDINGIRLDFGGIAKGYAADRAIAALRAHGVTSALISFGGEIVASNPPPGASGWPVSIEGMSDPVLIANSALSTSGDAEQFITIDSVRYSHVIDPRTGVALTSRVSATVQAPTGMLADALSTSATLVDSASAATLISAYPAARLVRRVSAYDALSASARLAASHPAPPSTPGPGCAPAPPK